MDLSQVQHELTELLYTGDQIAARIEEVARQVERDYVGKDLLLVGVLKGAVMVMADFSRALQIPVTMDWMALSSYGSGTSSSGVVRILKDIDVEVRGRDILIVEDILDSGLTLSWLQANLSAREPASVEIFTMFRKPDATKVDLKVKYVGYDIPNEFVVGYGLDYNEQYRNVRGLGILDPQVYS